MSTGRAHLLLTPTVEVHHHIQKPADVQLYYPDVIYCEGAESAVSSSGSLSFENVNIKTWRPAFFSGLSSCCQQHKEQVNRR